VNKNVIDFFFQQLERGNWETFSINEAIKILKLDEKEFKSDIPSKEAFLERYSDYIDEQVLSEIEEEDIKNSASDEIIQEYLMSKLDKLSPYKLAIANLVNYSVNNPKYVILGIKHNKKSITKFVNVISQDKPSYKSKILVKLLLAIWLLALNKWLYDENDEAAFAVIDKGIKKIKENTTFL